MLRKKNCRSQNEMVLWVCTCITSCGFFSTKETCVDSMLPESLFFPEMYNWNRPSGFIPS